MVKTINYDGLFSDTEFGSEEVAHILMVRFHGQNDHFESVNVIQVFLFESVHR